MRLEIEDDIGFKWVLRVGKKGDVEALLLLHRHWHGEWATDGEDGYNEYLCLHYYDSNRPNQPIDQRIWTCGACNHKVPPEVVRYYETVRWGLDTMMFEDEEL